MLINLALNKKAVSSSNETNYLIPLHVTNGKTHSETLRWSSGSFLNSEQWIYIDLDQVTIFNLVKLYWQKANAITYRIETSNDAVNWSCIYRADVSFGGIETLNVNKQNARYLRVYCEKNNPYVWNSVSLFEIEIYYVGIRESIKKKSKVMATKLKKNKNLALGKKAVSSSNETNYLIPLHVTNGKTYSENLRWSSGSFLNSEQWIYIDLEQITEFYIVRLYWQRANAVTYRIETSNDAINWSCIYRADISFGGIETLNVNKQSARYLRVYCEKNNSYVWSSVSLFEIEIYNEFP